MNEREDISKLTNEELAKELRKLSIVIGPITTTTRRIYENRLYLFLERRKKEDSQENGESTVDKTSENSKEQCKQESDACKENNNKNEEESKNTIQNLENEMSEKNIEITVSDNNNKKSSEAKMTTETISKTTDNNEQLINENGKEDVEISDGFFYGVWVPFSPLRISNQNKPNVFVSQKSTLKAMKKFNGSRFKQFKTKEEAEKFSLTEPQFMTVDNIIEMVANTKSAKKDTTIKQEIKAPTLQEVQKFRAYIEQNDIDNVEKCLENPRYLINTKDIPVVLHEGSRLNAMHVAVKCNRLNICRMIMCKLEEPEIFKLIYPDVADNNLEFRRMHLKKLYLNSPEKIMCDTPLHLGCKYGFVDVVKFLLSFPILSMHATNKDGKSASAIVCTRSNLRGEQKAALVQTLSSLLEDKAYIPLYHGDTIAEVGEPIVTVIPDASSVFSKGMRACIGPLSPCKAQSFYNKWKKSPREKKYRSIVRTDYEKGMERIGRSLATEENLPYSEYWDFLDKFINLSTVEGLETLENFLLTKSQQRCNTGDAYGRNRLMGTANDGVDNSPVAVSTANRYQENTTSDIAADGIKRRLSFDNASPPPVVIDMEKFTVEFKSSCKVVEDDNATIPPLVSEEVSMECMNGGHACPDFATPEREEMPHVYIYGDRPSKQDMDVLRAIENLDCDLTNFPYIWNWQKRLNQRQDRESWPSPGTPRYKKTMVSIEFPNDTF